MQSSLYLYECHASQTPNWKHHSIGLEVDGRNVSMAVRTVCYEVTITKPILYRGSCITYNFNFWLSFLLINMNSISRHSIKLILEADIKMSSFLAIFDRKSTDQPDKSAKTQKYE